MRFAKNSSQTRISSEASCSASSFENGLVGTKAREAVARDGPLLGCGRTWPLPC